MHNSVCLRRSALLPALAGGLALFLTLGTASRASADGPQLTPPAVEAPAPDSTEGKTPTDRTTPNVEREGRRHADALARWRDAVNGEMFDVASALRSLDQSYSKRGIVGHSAATGGSAWFDWRANGLCKPEGYVRALPPPPRVLGGCSSRCRGALCPECAPWLMGEVAKGKSIVGPVLPGTEAAPSPKLATPQAAEIEPIDLFTFTPGVPVVWRLSAVGEANLSGEWLSSGHGHVRVVGLDDSIATIGSERDAWSIEALIDHQSPAARFAPLVMSGEKTQSANFALCVEDDQLVLTLRTDAIAEGQPSWKASLTKLRTGLQHVLVAYRDGELCCFINGERVTRLETITGHLSNWSASPLVLGDIEPASRWSGRIGGVGLHPRFIDEDGAKQRFSFVAGSVAR